MGVGGAEALVLLFWLAVPILFLAGIYWVVRLAVRHGIDDARRDAAPARSAVPGVDPGPSAR